jgi:hypothetical protein
VPGETSRWRLRLGAGIGALMVAGTAVWGVMASQPSDYAGVRCSDFKTHAQAQAAYEDGAWQLDGDRDGVACEGLR